MKLKNTLLIITGALLLGGCTYSLKTTTTSAPSTYAPTATSTPTPSKTQTLNDLGADLDATVDDGGAADLNQLQKDSSGL